MVQSFFALGQISIGIGILLLIFGIFLEAMRPKPGGQRKWIFRTALGMIVIPLLAFVIHWPLASQMEAEAALTLTGILLLGGSIAIGALSFGNWQCREHEKAVRDYLREKGRMPHD